jgi:fucose permease
VVSDLSRRAHLTVALALVGFVSLGLPDGLLGVGWPSIRASFGLPLDALGPLLLTAACGYLLASVGSGGAVRRIGLGFWLALSSALMAAGLFGIALAPTWWILVVVALAIGFGGGAIDAGLNAYLALCHGARVLNWLHACFGVGATIGPFIMTTVLQVGWSWRWGYASAALIQVVLALAFMATVGLWRAGSVDRLAAPVREASLLMTLSQPAVQLGIALFFVYTGVETAIGQWCFTVLTEGRGLPVATAALLTSLYWGSFTVGRLLAGLAGDRVPAVPLVRLASLGIVVGAALLSLDRADGITFVGLAILGLACAPIFPTLIATTPARLGHQHATTAIGFQVGAASLGIALVPGLAGILAERFGLNLVYPAILISALVMVLLHEALQRVTLEVPT